MVEHHPLKKWRFNAGLTLVQLAARVGISRSLLSNLERGKGAASVRTARRIAEVTGLSLDDVLKESPKSE